MSKLIHTLAERLIEWRGRQRAYAELAALDDRSLADIGISRGDIPYLLDRKEQAPAPSGGRLGSRAKVA